MQQSRIRQRLTFAFLTIAIIPVLITGVILAWRSFFIQQQQAIALERNKALVILEKVTNFFDDLEQELRLVVGGESIHKLTPEEQKKQLEQFRTFLDEFEVISLVDVNGQETVRVARLQVFQPEVQGDLSASESFLYTKNKQTTYFSPVFFDEVTGEPFITIAVPIIDPQTGAFAGSIMGNARVKEIWDLISEENLLPGETIYMTDAEGKLLAAYRNSSLVLKGTQVTLPEEAGITTGLFGDNVILSFERLPLENQEFIIIAERSVYDAFSLAITTLLTALIAMVATPVVASVFAYRSVRQIVTPIEELVTAAQAVSMGDLTREVRVIGQDEISVLAKAFNEMTRQVRTLIGELEQRVETRTRALVTSTEVNLRLAQNRDLAALLNEAVHIIHTRFELYYTQIYLADAAGRMLHLRAGTGEIGKQLVASRHRLPLSIGSINGRAALEQKVIIVQDTYGSADFLPNPMLPETRSEASAPIIISGQLIGVLDMQSHLPDTFRDEMAPELENLARQLAIAIENARLFSEAERTRLQMAEQTRLLMLTGWENYLNAVDRSENLGFTYDLETLRPLDEFPLEPDQGSVAVPIQLAGEPIGYFNLQAAENESWTNDQVSLIQEIADRLAQRIEAIRLLSDANRYRMEADQAIRRLTREGWDAYLKSSEDISTGYVYDQHEVLPISRTQETDHLTESIVQPLVLRGETIGSLEVVLPEDEIVQNTKSQEVLNAIAETLTAHIENIRLSQTTEIALAQTEALYTVTKNLTEASTLENILETISGIRPGASATMLLIEADALGNPAWLITAASWPAAESQVALGSRFQLKDFPISSLWLPNPNKALVFENFETDSRVDPQTKAINLHFGFRAGIYLPLKVQDTWVGLITLSWPIPQAFSEGDVTLFDAVTAQAAIVVNNRLLLAQTTKRAEREAVINAINQRIQSATTVESTLEIATRELGKMLKARRAIVEIGMTDHEGSFRQEIN